MSFLHRSRCSSTSSVSHRLTVLLWRVRRGWKIWRIHWLTQYLLNLPPYFGLLTFICTPCFSLQFMDFLISGWLERTITFKETEGRRAIAPRIHIQLLNLDLSVFVLSVQALRILESCQVVTSFYSCHWAETCVFPWFPWELKVLIFLWKDAVCRF